MKEGLTPQEREAVVVEAIRLIKRPDTFIQGEWKCPIYERPKTHELVQVRQGMFSNDQQRRDLVPATDTSGRPLFAYCVEGAVNQAGINVLGLDRAITLEAATGTQMYGEPEPAHSSTFIEYLSVNEQARIMFADLFSQYGWDDPSEIEGAAQYINDDFPDAYDEYEDEHRPDKGLAHSRVMQILRRRLQLLRKGQ